MCLSARTLFSRFIALAGSLVVLFAAQGLDAQTAPVRFPGTTSVGQQSPAQTVLLTVAAGGTATAPVAVTEGVDAGEFAVTSGGTCASGTAYLPGQSCTVSVVFAPHFPGRRNGAVLLEDGTGQLLASTLLLGSATGALPRLSPGLIDTVAGDGSYIYAGDGVSAVGASLDRPQGLAVDVAGNLFISDSVHSRIRRVDAVTGQISTVVGTGSPGYNGDGALGSMTSVSQLAGLALDGAGNLYFADPASGLVRRLDAASGRVFTVAGTPQMSGYTGDGGLATAASLTRPEGIAFDDAGNLLIADAGNQVVRLVDSTNGHIRTIAGTGVAGFAGDGGPATNARLNQPWSLLVIADGSILLADLSNDRVRRISTTGIITTVAGNGTRGFDGDGRPASQTALNAPAGLAMDPAGNLYVADSANNRVRMMSVADGTIQTLAGTNDDAFKGDGGPADQASFSTVYALLFDAAGNLVVADLFHNRVRRISGQAITLRYPIIRVSKISQPKPQGLANSGNADLLLTQPGLQNAALDAQSTTCLTAPVAAGAICTLGVEFAPTVIGAQVVGAVTVNSNALPLSPVVTVQGQVLSVEPTATALTVSANPALLGDALQLTATVTSDDQSRSGDVTFLDGQTTLCTTSLNAGGTATCSTTTLALGQHTLTASYAGDANNASSVSPGVVEVIKQPAQLVLVATPNPAVVTADTTLQVTASATTGTPTGTITFFDGATPLGTAVLNGSGVATIHTSQLAPGPHALVAQYAGDATNAAGASNTVSEQVERASTSTTLSSSSASVNVGDSLTMTAQVSSPSGPALTGSLTFREGSTSLGVSPVDATGRASLSLSSLPPGVHAITAEYAGDPDSTPSTSTAFPVTVAQLTTSTSVTSDANPLSAGAVLRLSAAVTLAPGLSPAGALAGTVTFSDGATVLGTDLLDGSGHATLAVPGLIVGSHAITASYAGSTNYAPSTAPVLNETVASTPTTTALTSSTVASLSGKPVVFNVNVSSATAVPTGTVILHDGAAVVGQLTLSDHGTAAFTLSSLAVGAHSLSAAYSGDTNYTASTSTSVGVSVALAQPVLSLSGPSAPVTAGLPVTLTAVATSPGVAPAGTLSLHEGAVVLAAQAIGSGTVVFSTDQLAVGTHVLTVVYDGDGNNAAAASNAISVVVQQASTSITLAGASPATLGSTVSLLGNVSSNSPHLTGSVSFGEGSAPIGNTVLGPDGAARFTTSSLPVGDHTLVAVYSGDANHAASSSSVFVLRIVAPSAATVSSTVNPAISGTPVSFAAKISASVAGQASFVPTGSVTFSDNGNGLGSVLLDEGGSATFSSSALSVGVHTITVAYGGDAHYAASTASLVQTIASASTQVSLTASQNPAAYATPLTLTAGVTSNGGAATGAVVFRDGQDTIGSAVLNLQGVAQLTLATLAPGAHTLTAAYSGDGKAAASASAPLGQVVKQTTTAMLRSSENPALTLSPLQFTVTIGNATAPKATGTVTFMDGANVLGTAALDGNGNATFSVPQMTAGSHTLTASYEGDDKDFPSRTAASLTETIDRRVTTTALTSSSTNAADPQQVTLIALVHGEGSQPPSGTVSFMAGLTLVGTSPVDKTGVATLTIELEVKEDIAASYGGDSFYLGSSSAALPVAPGAATQFTLAVNPLAVSVATKQHVAVTLTMASVKGFNDTLKLGCLGLPFAATCTFSAPETKLAADGTSTVQLIIDTGHPLGSGAQTAQVHGIGNGDLGGHILLCLLPAGLLLAGSRRARRRLSAVQLLTLLLAAALTVAASGCAGLQQSGTPAGSYSFKVTASGAGTGATQSQTVALTVTE